ncbi:hypothetical protein H0X48_01375 [Candidatus Dependentiae bacterium]|nr:hypothetical protein [Candidatus Dependentiae bacterium]
MSNFIFSHTTLKTKLLLGGLSLLLFGTLAPAFYVDTVKNWIVTAYSYVTGK